MLEAAITLAENWLQLTRLELTVFADNEAALALYRKFGFELEGSHRQYAFRNGTAAHNDDCMMCCYASCVMQRHSV